MAGSRAARLRAIGLLTAGLVSAGLATGCGADPQSDYSQRTQDNFIAACTDPLEDDLLHVKLCQCVFTEMQDGIQFDDFRAIESEIESARENSTPATLPAEVVAVVAACVIDEADL